MSTETSLHADFIHLHTHSHYSLLHALPTTKELAHAAKEARMPALALTDNGALYGAIDFIKSCMKADIKPIIGIDAYLAPRTRFDKEANIDKPRSRLVLLAKNNTGYKNLIKMVTESYTHGFYYRPRIDHELLKTLGNDLVCILPSFSGETTLALKDNDIESAGASLDWYRSVFGDDCYLEITHHPEINGHEETQKKIIGLGKDSGVPLVAAHDVYYLKQSDYLARETMVKIGTGGTVETIDGFGESGENFSFINQDEAKRSFKETPEALQNSVRIAEQCTVELAIGTTWYFPNYIIESGRSPDDELRETAYEGVPWRGLSLDDPEVKTRLDYELGVIKDKGYAKYFLVVGDLINEARRRRILTTIRGSVAGSLTTYVLGITNVDPLEYKIPFERFLNPERPSAPDIDMDYADNRRDEMIEYAREKYGADKVAQIGTFGTMMARAAVRDVARALGYPYASGDQIAKLIPIGSQGFPMTIEQALKIEPALKERYEKDAETREIIDLARQIEGRVRHLGVHAAGVVIAPEPLSEFVPVQPDPKTGKLITQYEMNSVGEDGVGLLKFDFLGIKNLSILAESVRRVGLIHGVDIDIENIPLDDRKTFEMLARGETMGLFQLNGTGMTAFLKQLQPTSIHDINAMVALYRPGPMDNIPEYIARKHNPSLVSYPDPRMAEYLEESLGVIVYQEDVLLSAIKLAGYSWLEADKFRKAMGKKIPAVMAAEKEKLTKGLIENGQNAAFAEKLWKLFEPFQGYGFNKAHAASYGRVAYQTAYMKANYPVEYMSAVLTADSGDTDKISEIIQECVRMEIDVLPPDINESFGPFSVVPAKDTEPAKIRFGLTTIKNFGEGISEAIVEERKENGPFSSLTDFLSRVTNKNLNKKSLESLIKVGALDRFGERGTLLYNLENILNFSKEQAAQRASSQDSLFRNAGDRSLTDIVLEPAPDATTEEKLLWEKELLGVYVSGHPLDAYEEEISKRPSITAIKKDRRNGIPLVTVGMIETVRELLTKKGERMAFLKLVDRHDSIEMVAFPEIYRAHRDILLPGSCVAVKGRLSMRNDEPTIALEKIKMFGKEKAVDTVEVVA